MGVEFPVRFPPEVRFGDAPGAPWTLLGDAPGANNGDGPPLPTGDPVGIEESNRITTDKDFEGGPCFSEGPVCLLFGKVPTSRPLILHTHKLVIYGKHVTTGNVFRITDLFPPERLR